MRLFQPPSPRRSVFGDTIIVLFLVLQALDGVFTYVGLAWYGPGAEGNPLIASAMPLVGQGVALASAKLIAASFGAMLHLSGVHRVVAALTAFYLVAAVVPWALLLLS